jgi:hypothetical protein
MQVSVGFLEDAFEISLEKFDVPFYPLRALSSLPNDSL